CTSETVLTLSAFPHARVLPSGLKAREEVTASGSARRVARSWPVVTSHNFTVLSQPPTASVLPSGLNATAATPERDPGRAARSGPLAASHNFTVVSDSPSDSPSAVASVLPSGLKATLRKIEV